MNLIIQGQRAKQIEKNASMDKDALLGLSTAATIAVLAAALPVIGGAARAWGGPALGWAKRKIWGRSDKSQARLDSLRSQRRGYDTMRNLPYAAGGLGVGAGIGNLVTGSPWGTALGGLGGLYLGNRYADDIRQWMGGGQGKTANVMLKGASMEKEGAAFTLGTLLLASILSGVAIAGSEHVTTPAMKWLKNKTVGRSPTEKAQSRLRGAKVRAAPYMRNIPYWAGGAGLGALLGNVATGSGWGTALGGVAGGYLGNQLGNYYGKDISNTFNEWAKGWGGGDKKSAGLRKNAQIDLFVPEYAYEVGKGLIGNSGAWHYLFGPSAGEYRQGGRAGEIMQNWPTTLAGAGLGGLAGWGASRMTGSGSVAYPLALGLIGAYLGRKHGKPMRDAWGWLSGQGKKDAAVSGMDKQATIWTWLGKMLLDYSGNVGTEWGAGSLFRGLKNKYIGPSREAVEEYMSTIADRSMSPTSARMNMAKWPALAGAAGGLGYNYLTGSKGWAAPLTGALALGTAGYFAPDILRWAQGKGKKSASVKGAGMNLIAVGSVAKREVPLAGQKKKASEDGNGRCKCPACGHVQGLPEGADPASQTCNNCGHEGMMSMEKAAAGRRADNVRAAIAEQKSGEDREDPAEQALQAYMAHADADDLVDMMPTQLKQRFKEQYGESSADWPADEVARAIQNETQLGSRDIGLGERMQIGGTLGLLLGLPGFIGGPQVGAMTMGGGALGGAALSGLLGPRELKELQMRSAAQAEPKEAAARRAQNMRALIQLHKAAIVKTAYIEKQKGTNSEGEATDWVIKSHETDKVIGHYKTEKDAKAALRAMKANSN